MQIIDGKKMVKAQELQLADTIKNSPFGEWNMAIVKQVTPENVTLFRPYGTTADFAWTGGVICYIGVEEYTISRDSDVNYELIHRKELR